MKLRNRQNFICHWRKKYKTNDESAGDVGQDISGESDLETELSEPVERPRGRPMKLLQQGTTTAGGGKSDEESKEIMKRHRGRPRKTNVEPVFSESDDTDDGSNIKRPRGRPRKKIASSVLSNQNTDIAMKPTKRPRGRPPKGTQSVDRQSAGVFESNDLKEEEVAALSENNQRVWSSPSGQHRASAAVSECDDNKFEVSTMRTESKSGDSLERASASKDLKVFDSPSKEGCVSSRGRKTTRFNFAALEEAPRKRQKIQSMSDSKDAESKDTVVKLKPKNRQNSASKASSEDCDSTAATTSLTSEVSTCNVVTAKKSSQSNQAITINLMDNDSDNSSPGELKLEGSMSEAEVKQEAIKVASFDDLGNIQSLVDSAEVNVVEELGSKPRDHVSFKHDLGDVIVPVCSTCCELFHCPLCDNSVGRHRWQFMAHFIRKHWNQRFFFTGSVNVLKCCLACVREKKAASQSTHYDGHYHCPICPRVSANASKFHRHIRHHRLNTAQETSQCSDGDSDELSMSENEGDDDSEVVESGAGDAELFTLSLSVDEIDERLKSLFLRSEVCSVPEFKIKEVTQKHKTIVNDKITLERCDTCCRGYRCPLCDVVMASRLAVSSHFIRVHFHKRFHLRGFFVLRCGLKCIGSDTSSTHPTPLHFHCPLCPVLSFSAKAFTQHLTNHPKIKPVTKPAKQIMKVNNLTSFSIWCWRRPIGDEDYDGSQNSQAAEDGQVLDTKSYLSMLNGDRLALSSMGNRELTILSRLSAEAVSFESIIEEARVNALKAKKIPPRFREAMSKLDWEKMLQFMPGKHLSYVNHLSEIEVMRCETCCDLFHCPLCPREESPSVKPNQLRCHLLRIHWNKRFVFSGGMSVLRCNRSCPVFSIEENKTQTVDDNISYNSHYHCPLCQQIKSTVNKFHQHLRAHVCGTAHEIATRKKPSKQVVARLKSFMETGRDLSEEELEKLARNGKISEIREVTEEAKDADVCDENVTMETTTGSGEEINIAITNESAADVRRDGEHVVSTPGSKKSKRGLRSVAAMVDLDVLQQLPISTIEFAALLSELIGVSCTLCENSDGGQQGLVQGSLEQIQIVGELLEKLEVAVTTSADELRQLILAHSSSLRETVSNEDLQGKAIEVADQDDASTSQTPVIVKQETGDNLGDDFTVVFDEDGNATFQVLPGADDKLPEPEQEPEHDSFDQEDIISDENIVQETVPPNVGSSSKLSGDAILNRRKKTLSCPLCSKRFRAMWSLLPHFIKAHKDVAEAEEDEDDSEMVKTVKGHVRTMKMLDECLCPLCGKTFKSLQEAKIHFALRTCEKRPAVIIDTDLPINLDNNMFKCPMCDEFESTRAARVIDHMARIHAEKTVPCKACDKKFANEKLLKQHMKLNHIYKKKMAVCDLCGVEIVASYLQKHMQIMHDPTYVKTKTPREKYVQCKECSYQAPRRCDLLKHVMRKHRDRKFTCDQCQQKFALEDDLKYHIKYIHLKDKESDPSSATVTCEECGKSMQQRNMDVHIRRVHRKQRDHVCDLCDKPFSSKYSLRIHKMSIHTRPEDRQYKFVCDYCPAGFFNKRIYKDHLNTHTGHRPYKCQICDKRFKQVNIFRNHMMTHDPKRHTCQTCNAVFNSRLELTSHMREHPLWKCVCTQRFPTAKSLLEHQALCNILKSKQTQGQVSLLQTRAESLGASENEQNFVVIHPGGESTSTQESTVLVVKSEDGGTAETTTMAVTHIMDGLTATPVVSQGQENIIQLWDVPVGSEVGGQVKSSSGDGVVLQLYNNANQILDSFVAATEQHGNEVILTEESGVEKVEIVDVGECSEVVTLEAMEELLTPQADEADEDTSAEQVYHDGDLSKADEGEQNQFLCGYCEQSFVDMDSVQQHMMTDHSEMIVSQDEDMQLVGLSDAQ